MTFSERPRKRHLTSNPLPITPNPTPAACGYTPISESWAPGCSGSVPAGSVSINGTVTVNNTATGYSGAVTYRCETSGGGAPSLVRKTATCNAGATCSYAAFGKSPGDTIEWANGAGTAFCAGPLPAPPAPGGSVTVTDNTMNGTTDLATGTYRATCRTDGTWDPNAVVTCNEPPASKCNPRAVSWTGADGSQCSGSTTLTPYGQTVTVFSDNGSTGATDITCNPGTCTWGAPFNSNCEKPVQPCPGGGTMAWGNCYGPGPAKAMASGEQYTTYNAALGYTGLSNNTCKNGVWMQDSASCNSNPSVLNCGSTTLTWTQGASSCSATASETASGSIVNLTDSTAPCAGAATATCTNGVWSTPTGTCSEPVVDQGCPEQLVGNGQTGLNYVALLVPAVSASGTYRVTNTTTESADLISLSPPNNNIECGAFRYTFTTVCASGSWGLPTYIQQQYEFFPGPTCVGLGDGGD